MPSQGDVGRGEDAERGRQAASADDVRLVAKVALDTAETDRGLVLQALQTPKTIKTLSGELERSWNATDRVVHELKRLKLVQECGKGGQGALYGWTALSEKVMKGDQ